MPVSICITCQSRKEIPVAWIADIEKVLDEVIFLKEGQVVRQDPVDRIREQEKKSVDALFREIFAVPMGAMDWDTHGREGER